MSYMLSDKPTKSAWGYCEVCDVSISIATQANSFAPEEEWEMGIICPVCGLHLMPESITYAELEEQA